MCLIPTFTEEQKLKQVNKVLSLIALPVDTEEQKQKFLYELSFMNNMVVKGYLQERTDMDEVIYETKDKAIDSIVERMPERCFLSYGKRRYIVYVFAMGRQYSFHTNSRHGLTYDKYIEWDGISNGWSLTTEEYKVALAAQKARAKANEEKDAADLIRFNKDVKLRMIKGIKIANKHNEEVRAYFANFWEVLDKNLTASQKKSKAYKTKDMYKCYSLYGEKLGLEYRYVYFYRSPAPNGGDFDSSKWDGGSVYYPESYMMDEVDLLYEKKYSHKYQIL